jgi:hypothetical protein
MEREDADEHDEAEDRKVPDGSGVWERGELEFSMVMAVSNGIASPSLSTPEGHGLSMQHSSWKKVSTGKL